MIVGGKGYEQITGPYPKLPRKKSNLDAFIWNSSQTVEEETINSAADESIWWGTVYLATGRCLWCWHKLVLMQRNMTPDVTELCSTEDYDPLGFVSKIKGSL